MMKQGKAGCPRIEIKAGSGLILMTTVSTLKNPSLETVVEVVTDSEDFTGTISTILETVVV